LMVWPNLHLGCHPNISGPAIENQSKFWLNVATAATSLRPYRLPSFIEKKCPGLVPFDELDLTNPLCETQLLGDKVILLYPS
jgi:hypothetical protein